MLNDSKETDKENSLSISEDYEKFNKEDEKSLSSDSSNDNKKQFNDNFYSNSSSSSVSSSVNDNMEFSKALVLDSNSTKNTDKEKKIIKNIYQTLIKKPLRLLEEEDSAENNFTKKTKEYFYSSPQKNHIFRTRTFNLKNENDKNIETASKLSSLIRRKKRFSLVGLGEEKSKVHKKTDSVFSFHSKNGEETNNGKKVRRDNNGVEICKKNKKLVKIKFAEPLENVEEIECLKGLYTVTDPRLDNDDFVPGDKIKCQCCSIY